MSLPRDVDHDLNNPVNTAAEVAVFAYLRETCGFTTWDYRHRWEAYDGAIHTGGPQPCRFDVKCDSYIDGTRRIPWELWLTYPDGRRDPGWAQNTDLDLIAVVYRWTWRVVFVRVPRVRHLVARVRPDWALPDDWRRFKCENMPRSGRPYHGEGWAIPLDACHAIDAVAHVGHLPGTAPPPTDAERERYRLH
jgi:hypothetical protein